MQSRQEQIQQWQEMFSGLLVFGIILAMQGDKEGALFCCLCATIMSIQIEIALHQKAEEKKMDNEIQKTWAVAKTQAMYLNGPFGYAANFKQGFFNCFEKARPSGVSQNAKKMYDSLTQLTYLSKFEERYGDCYTILGIDPSANEDEIKKAYRKLAREWHPDKNPGKNTNEEFQKIDEAKNILLDKEQKIAHDYFLEAKNNFRLR